MYLPGIPRNFIKIIVLILTMLKNFLSPPPIFKVCRFSTKNFCYDGNPLAVIGNNLGISLKIFTFVSNIINFLMTLMKDSSQSWIVALSLSCGLCTTTHVKVTIVFFCHCNQAAKCAVSAVPEMDVAKHAIFLQILHAHPTINHFIAWWERGNPLQQKERESETEKWYLGYSQGSLLLFFINFAKAAKALHLKERES